MCEISIILLNYKNPELTANCISSILRVNSKIPYEIIVVDNHSEDGSVDLLKQKFPEIFIKDSGKNGGFAFGNNVGVRMATGKYLLLLNNDTEIMDGMLDLLYEYAEKHEEIGMIGCRALDRNGVELPVAHSFETLYRILLQTYVKPFLDKLHLQRKLVSICEKRKINQEEFILCQWISGSAMFIKKELYYEFGGLDENFFMYMEDEDLSRRLNMSGYSTGIINKFGYTHFCGGSTINSYFLTKEYIKSRLIFFMRYDSKNFRWIKKALYSQIPIVNTKLDKYQIKKMKNELEQFVHEELKHRAESILRI